MRRGCVGSLVRVAVVLGIWGAGAAGQAEQTANPPTSFMLNFTCMVSYGAQGVQGLASGSCTGSVVPLGGATAVLSLRAAYDDEADKITGVTGSLVVTMINNATFSIALAGGNAGKDQAGRVVVNADGLIQGGTGTLEGAGGSARVALVGIPVKEGTATVSAGGEGSITAPGLSPGPAVALGPGSLGNTSSTVVASCGNPVTVSNGNMYHQFVDLRVAARGRPIVVRRTYNSQANSTPGPFGYGWTHNLQSAIYDQGSVVIYKTESGGSLMFNAAKDGYVAVSDAGLHLAKAADGWLVDARAGLSARFDAKGRLVEMSGSNGDRQLLSYDGSGRLESVSELQGGRIGFSYDELGRIIAIQDHTGRTATYEYDAAGNLSVSIDPAGARTVYTYYAELGRSHVLESIAFPGGGAVGFEYEANGRVARTVDSAGGVMSIDYGSSGTTITDSLGGATTYEFNQQGSITKVINADGTSVSRVFDAAGRTVESVDEEGFRTTFTYDEAGRQVTKTDALGQTVSYSYDELTGRIGGFRNAASNVTNRDYDERGNLIRVFDPLGGETAYDYDGSGNLLSVADAAGVKVEYRYTAEGVPESVHDAAGLVAAGELDSLKRLIAARNPAGREQRFEYDAKDRIVKSTDSVLGTSLTAYGDDGRVASMKDPGGRATKFAYDTLGNLIETKDAAGGLTQYQYKPVAEMPAVFGLLSAIKDARGKTALYKYDVMGRIVSATDAAGGVRNFTWTPRGDVASLTAEDGTVTEFQYDAVRRLVSQTLPDGTKREFTHDERGNVLTASNGNVTYTFTYDAAGRTTGVTDERGPWKVEYDYDAAGRRTAMTVGELSRTVYEYDGAGRLVKVMAPEGEYVFAYNKERQRSSLTFPGGMQAQYGYDPAGRITVVQYGSPSVPVAARLETSYDSGGNVATAVDHEGLHTYAYDELGRLIAARHAVQPAEAYEYDTAGNRMGEDVRYGDDNRLLAGWGSRYGYDGKGNVLSRESAEGTAWFEYGFDNRLTGAMTPDGRWAVYKYDPFGRRIEKNLMGVITRYVYDADRLLMEVDEAGTVLARYTYRPQSNEALGFVRGDASYAYLTDGRSNVIALGGADGGVALRYSFGAFGQNLTVSGGEVENPIVFAMRERDAETGLVHMGARHYDPSTGRFLQKDPIDFATAFSLRQQGRSARGASMATVAQLLMQPASLHPYTYALNNPMAFTDWTGLFNSAIPGITDQAPGAIIGQIMQAVGFSPGQANEAGGLDSLKPSSSLLAALGQGGLPGSNSLVFFEQIRQAGVSDPEQLLTALMGYLNQLHSGTAAQSCKVSEGSTGMLNPDQIYLNQVNQQAADAQALYNSNSQIDIQQAQAAIEQQIKMVQMLSELLKSQHDMNMAPLRNLR